MGDAMNMHYYVGNERGNLVGALGNNVTMFSWGNQYGKQVGIATVCLQLCVRPV